MVSHLSKILFERRTGARPVFKFGDIDADGLNIRQCATKRGLERYWPSVNLTSKTISADFAFLCYNLNRRAWTDALV